LEENLSRVINPDNAGKERNRLKKSIVIAIRALMEQSSQNEASKDLAAYIGMALCEIHATIDPTVEAWEKRDYWIKADRFRREWEWTQALGDKMKKAVLDEQWADVAQVCVQVAQRFMNVEVSPRHRLGKPWVGAWKRLIEEY
jgi:hypothetical protein